MKWRAHRLRWNSPRTTRIWSRSRWGAPLTPTHLCGGCQKCVDVFYSEIWLLAQWMHVCCVWCVSVDTRKCVFFWERSAAICHPASPVSTEAPGEKGHGDLSVWTHSFTDRQDHLHSRQHRCANICCSVFVSIIVLAPSWSPNTCLLPVVYYRVFSLSPGMTQPVESGVRVEILVNVSFICVWKYNEIQNLRPQNGRCLSLCGYFSTPQYCLCTSHQCV